MSEFDYQDWILKYCPAGVEPELFVDRLAMGAIAIIQEASVKTGLSVSEIVQRFYCNDSEPVVN